jgi:MoxR-like ATPase
LIGRSELTPINSGTPSSTTSSSPVSEPQPRFASPADVHQRLLEHGYLGDEAIADAVFLADGLGKSVLAQGPAGVGKTQLAKTVAAVTGSPLVRLQCYEGLDEGKALYEWDYRKQLLRLQASGDEPASWSATASELYSEAFLLPRPLLQALLSDVPVVLLVDEVDRLEVEAEALLLEVLAEGQVTIPELGTLRARAQPLVFLTSNGTRELSEALKRRCLFLHIDYPDARREAQILSLRVPNLDQVLAAHIAQVVKSLRELDLRKAPSLSESIDWARTLQLLGVTEIDKATLRRTLPVLLKNQADIDVASALTR